MDRPRLMPLTIRNIVDATLHINPSYQRGDVWSLNQRQCFIDSIMRNYPVPAIFLLRVKAKPSILGGNEDRFEIIDGQQRLHALAGYFAGDFPLLRIDDRKNLPLPGSLRKHPKSWAGLRFSELQEDDRRRLEEFEVNTYIIETADMEEVRDLFIRLQSGTPLTRQQVRDAWPGQIGPFIVGIAGKRASKPKTKLFRFVGRWGSSSDDIESSDTKDEFDADRQFCAQLLLLHLARRRGNKAPGLTAKALDHLYHDEMGFRAESDEASCFKKVINHTQRVFETARSKSKSITYSTKNRFRKAHVMIVFLLFHDLATNPLARIDDVLYDAVADNILSELKKTSPTRAQSGEAILQYYERWREEILPLVVHRDPRRNFTEEEAKEIFERDCTLCHVCGEKVEWGKHEIDHDPIPWELGGRTDLSNGRLVHAPPMKCHSRGRNALRKSTSIYESE